jgi:tripeptidyl-peptidase-1
MDVHSMFVHRPFIPDADEPTASDDENEPYLIYYEYLLSKDISEIPQVISNSYGDDEQASRVLKSFSRKAY